MYWVRVSRSDRKRSDARRRSRDNKYLLSTFEQIVNLFLIPKFKVIGVLWRTLILKVHLTWAFFNDPKQITCSSSDTINNQQAPNPIAPRNSLMNVILTKHGSISTNTQLYHVGKSCAGPSMLARSLSIHHFIIKYVLL